MFLTPWERKIPVCYPSASSLAWSHPNPEATGQFGVTLGIVLTNETLWMEEGFLRHVESMPKPTCP